MDVSTLALARLTGATLSARKDVIDVCIYENGEALDAATRLVEADAGAVWRELHAERQAFAEAPGALDALLVAERARLALIHLEALAPFLPECKAVARAVGDARRCCRAAMDAVGRAVVDAGLDVDPPADALAARAAVMAALALRRCARVPA